MDYVSKEKLEELKAELGNLEGPARKEIANRLEEAKKMGDLSENAEYSAALEMQERIEMRIREIEHIIKNAFIIKKPLNYDTINIGSVIKASYNGGYENFKIVGSHEVNPSKGEISNESPLGKAFIGHRAGDIIEVRTPKGVKKFKIMGIS